MRLFVPFSFLCFHFTRPNHQTQPQTTISLIHHPTNKPSFNIKNKPGRILSQLLPDQGRFPQHSEIITDALLQTIKQ